MLVRGWFGRLAVLVSTEAGIFAVSFGEDLDILVTYAGDLLFGCEAKGLSEFGWNSKTAGGKLGTSLPQKLK